MSSGKESDGSYVDKVRQSNRAYVESLLDELNRSRRMTVTMEREVSSYKEEKLRLQGQLLDLREELDRRNTEQLRLQRELMEIESRNNSYSEEYLVVEQQNANLANLYVASYRLHGTLELEEVIEAIKEIVINLVGSEQLAIYELEGNWLKLIGSFGIDQKKYARLELGKGTIGKVAAGAGMFTRKGNSQVQGIEENLTACIPLEIGGRVTGVIAIFRLLEQKSRLEELDFEMFELFKTHASTALYSAALHAKCTAEQRMGGESEKI